MSTIVVHASSSRMCPSRNANFVTLTSLSQCSVSSFPPWSPPLSMRSSVLPSFVMVLPTVSFVVSALPLQYLLLPAVCLKYSPIALVLGLPRPPAGTTSRDPPSALRFFSALLWWVWLSYHWPLSDNSRSWSMIPSPDQPLLDVEHLKKSIWFFYYNMLLE